MTNIYFLGTAGSGKTTLVSAFKQWMKKQGYDCITVNLDPGAERLPYSADVDVREWINLSDVMDKYSLGPNGAQIICADMLALKAKEIGETIEEFKTDYVLLDTPGQVELFAYREASKAVIEIFGAKESLMAFLFDPVLASLPSGFISLVMLCTSMHFRLELPVINLLSKTDLLEKEEIDKILEWGNDSSKLYDALSKSQSMVLPSLELFEALEKLQAYKEIYPVSSKNELGMDDIYNAVQQVFFGGEDLER